MVLWSGVTIQTILLIYFIRNPEYNSLWFSKGGRVGMGVVNPPKCLVYRCAYVKMGVVNPPKLLSTGVPMSKWGVVNPPKPLSTGVPMSKWGLWTLQSPCLIIYLCKKKGGCEPSKALVYRCALQPMSKWRVVNPPKSSNSSEK
jgi:hypothetical protein